MFPLPADAAYNSELETASDIVLLVSLDDGTVLFDKNSTMRTAPAALAMIAAAAVTLESISDPSQKITAAEGALRPLNAVLSTKLGLKAGEEISVFDLVCAMLLASATDAANVLAYYVGGENISAFVDMMNETAAKAGCADTHFTNAHGLDDENQYTTAADIAALTKYALNIPVFKEISGLKTHEINATNKSSKRTLYSTVLLMNAGYRDYYYSYSSGIKTGSTDKAGRCVVSTASKDGYSYLAVVMKGPYTDRNKDGAKENLAFIDCKKLFDWTIKNIRLRTVAEASQTVAVIEVKSAKKVDHLRLVPEKEVTALVPMAMNSKNVLIETVESETAKTIEAPVEKGAVLGRAKIFYAGEEIASVNLVAAEKVELSFIKAAALKINKIVTNKNFLTVTAASALVVILIISALLLRDHNKNKSRAAKRPDSTKKPPDDEPGDKNGDLRILR
ncbi:MAG: serine hydrolase [Oscillospiraceae bacterium]|nr:serine hydrolase [Oscillospiraceae bacterium]